MTINLTQVILGLVTIGFVVRGLRLAWRQGRRGWTTGLFLAFGAVVITYVITNYFSLNPPRQTMDDQLFWIRVVTSLGGPMPTIAILLAACYPGEKFRFPKWPLLVLLTGCLATFVLSFTPFVFSSLQYVKGIPDPKPEIGLLFTWGFFYIGVFLAAIGVAIRGYLRSPLAEKSQRLYFLVGLIASFALMTLSSFIPNAVLRSSATIFIGPVTWVVFFVLVPMGYPKSAVIPES